MLNFKFSLIILLISFTHAFASDLEREKRHKDEIIDYILDGEPVMLNSNSHQFLSIYQESEQEKIHGAVIIMHGRGFHPNWKDVVYPLRTGLVDYGWHTLSIQMPVLQNKAKYYDYVPILSESFPRINSAIKFLKDKGIKKIIFIAHSCSVHMSMAWIDKYETKDINAYIGIGMGATDYKQPMLEPFPLEKITVPVLDIYGSKDYPAVHILANERMSIYKKLKFNKTKQIVIDDADHFMTEKGDELLEQVALWLDTL